MISLSARSERVFIKPGKGLTRPPLQESEALLLLSRLASKIIPLKLSYFTQQVLTGQPQRGMIQIARARCEEMSTSE
jgi:hypothetical protein